MRRKDLDLLADLDRRLAGDGLNVAAVAAEYGVSLKTIRRAVDLLRVGRAIVVLREQLPSGLYWQQYAAGTVPLFAANVAAAGDSRSTRGKPARRVIETTRRRAAQSKPHGGTTMAKAAKTTTSRKTAAKKPAAAKAAAKSAKPRAKKASAKKRSSDD